MTIEERKVLCGALRALASSATEPNQAGKYAAFGIKKGDRFRIAVSVSAAGASFFTENQGGVLERLAANGVISRESDRSKSRNKKRYIFPQLNLKQVHDHEDDFRKLVSDSISIKDSGLQVKNRDLLKLIKKDGWQYSYSTGGHDHYKHPTKPGKVTFCGHPTDEVAPGTLISILKQAGLR